MTTHKPPPPAIRIGPHRFTVKVDNNAEEDEGRFGSSSYGRLWIRLRDNIPPGQVADTLLHEVLHMTVAASDSKRMFDDESEERLVSQLTPVLLGVLWDNPDLLAYLTSAQGDA